MPNDVRPEVEVDTQANYYDWLEYQDWIDSQDAEAFMIDDANRELQESASDHYDYVHGFMV